MKSLHGSYGAANPSLAEAKVALRARMRTLRRRLAESLPDAARNAAIFACTAGVSPALAEDAGETPAVQGRVVAGYTPQGSELDPGPLIDGLVLAGWTPALPRAADRESPMSFHAAVGRFTPDVFGIPAPPTTTPVLIPDLVIVPVLAFDRAGGRLGQGAGCYDRTLVSLRAAADVLVIGLAYAGQEVPRVPTDNHDQRLDGILTDEGFIEVLDRSE